MIYIILFYFFLLNNFLDHILQGGIHGSKVVTTFMTPVIGCLSVLQKDLTTNRFSSLWRLEGNLPSARTPKQVMPEASSLCS